MKPNHHFSAYRQVNQVEEMIVLLVTCLAALLSPSIHAVDWCYHKPECNSTTWPTIASQFCNGTKQSPINIVTANVQGNSNLTSFNVTGFNDSSVFLNITNTGFSVEAALISSKVTVQGGNLPGLYNATKITLHWGKGNSTLGSEHTVDGKQYPMELQILSVHSKYNGNEAAALAANDSTGLAVFSFFIEAIQQNQTNIWFNLTSALPLIAAPGKTLFFTGQFTLENLLEGVNRSQYYRYQGSLTTPNCNEVVIWTVFKQPIKVSQNLINLFSGTVQFNSTEPVVLMTNNFRGVQSLNGRNVTSQVSAASSTVATSTLSIITVLLLSSLF